ERAHRRLAAGPGALDAHLDVLHAAFLCRAAATLGRDLRGERRRLARALEAGIARGRPGQRVALAVGDGDDGVVERGVDVRDALGHVLLDLLARARGSGLLQLLARRCVTASHLCGLPGLDVELDRCLARTLARPRVGPGPLPAYRETFAVTRAAVAVQVDQALDRHLHFAAQVALDREAPHALADALELGVGQL